ncbi:MAG: TIM barrel protein [Anaerolineales bacterium]|nr:TIM barrel protein [Anaerolineales bacterium]
MNMDSFRFGTVGSPKNKPKKPGGSVGGIYYLNDLGLQALELGWVRSVRVSESTAANIKEAGQERDVALSVHAPYYINLNADQEEWPKSRQRLMDAARAGHQSGATDIVFHPGSYFGKPAAEVLKVALPRLDDCVKELRAEDNPVILRPETMGKGAMLGSLEDTLEMSQLAGVEPCLDFAHLHARPGDGSVNTYQEWMDILYAYRDALGEKSLGRLHCHLSGIEYTEKGEQNHLVISESDFDLSALFQALLDSKAGGRILCESPTLEEDALFIQKSWLELTTNSTT